MENDEILLPPDEPPKSGEWVDNCAVVATPTAEEIDLGKYLGETIDPESDDFIEDDYELISRGSGSTERQRAMQKAQEMKAILLEHGAPEVSIELMGGRPSPYGVWDSGFFVSDMSHHIVSRFGTNLTPGLYLCKAGRSDLPGPLCNGYGGFDLCYRIFTFGYANHPGQGGPITLPALTAGKFTIPRDSARRYAWGTEWEGGLNAADWDRVLKNPRNGTKMTMREFMGRVNAGLEEALKIHENAHMEHSTWTSRKIDRLGYTAAKGIAEKRPYREPAKKEVYLPTVDLSNLQKQFRIGLGLDKGTLKSIPGVRVVQRQLNLRYGENLTLDGKAGLSTANAWGRHEKATGIKDRIRVPDEKSLAALATTTHFRFVE